MTPSNGLGWTHPLIILGSVLGAAALVIIAAGLLSWDGVLQPIAPFVPGATAAEVSTAHVATFALAALIALKWLIATAMAVFAQTTQLGQILNPPRLGILRLPPGWRTRDNVPCCLHRVRDMPGRAVV